VLAAIATSRQFLIELLQAFFVHEFCLRIKNSSTTNSMTNPVKYLRIDALRARQRISLLVR